MFLVAKDTNNYKEINYRSVKALFCSFLKLLISYKIKFIVN